MSAQTNNESVSLGKLNLTTRSGEDIPLLLIAKLMHQSSTSGIVWCHGYDAVERCLKAAAERGNSVATSPVDLVIKVERSLALNCNAFSRLFEAVKPDERALQPERKRVAT